MSLKSLILFVLLVLLAIYFAFLNPESVPIRLTRSLTVEAPIVVFLLTAMLAGVLLTALFQSFLEVQSAWNRFWENLRVKRQEARHKKWDKLFRKAENALASGRTAKGRALLEKLLADHPYHTGALYHLGNLMRQEGRVERAIELHQAALTAEPEDYKVLHSLAEDYAAAGAFDQQAGILNRRLELDPHSLPTLRKLRDLYRHTQKLEQAYQTQKAILPLIHGQEELQREQEQFAQIIYALGLDHFQNGRLDKAIAEFKRALREDERSLPAYVTLGDLYLQAGNPRQAVKTWKNGFEMTRSPVCLLRLAAHHEKEGHPEEIHKLFRKALAQSENPREGELLALLYAQRLLKEGKSQEAWEVLEPVPEPALLTRVFQIRISNELNPDQARQTLLEAFKQASGKIQSYTCTACGKTLESWSAFCPGCQAWNRVVCGPGGMAGPST